MSKNKKGRQRLELGAQIKLQTVSKPFRYWVSEPSFWYWGANWDYFLVSILVCPNHHPYCCRIIILDTFIILSLASSNIVVTYHHFCRRTDGDKDTFVKDIIEDDKKEKSFFSKTIWHEGCQEWSYGYQQLRWCYWAQVRWFYSC